MILLQSVSNASFTYTAVTDFAKCSLYYNYALQHLHANAYKQHTQAYTHIHIPHKHTDHTHACAHTHTHTHIHTHTYTHTHTYMGACERVRGNKTTD